MSIPLLPGIPPLRTTISRNLISTGIVALIDSFITQSNQVWGIFDSKGKKVLLPDTFLGVDYQNNWRVSDYPVESGVFASYNKIATPFNATVTVAQGGTNLEKTTFTTTLKKIAGDLNLYTIITPNESFVNATIERYGYERRIENGANIIIANISFTEVRSTPSIRYTDRSGNQITTTVPVNQQTQTVTSTGVASPTDTQHPSAQSSTNNGSVSIVSSPLPTGVIQ